MAKSEPSSAFRIIEAAIVEAEERTPVFERCDYGAVTVEYVLSGYGFLEEGAQAAVRLGPEDVYILKRHEDHRYWQDRNAPWKKIYLTAAGPLADLLCGQLIPQDVFTFPQCGEMRSRFEALLSPAPAERQALLFHELLFELASRTGPAAAERPEKMTPERRLQILLDQAMEKPFRLQECAEELGFTRSYLIRRFRSAFGTTPYDYLLKKRIRKAEDLILFSELSLKEIAEKLLFADEGAFSRCFRQQNGIPPRTFRERNRALSGASGYSFCGRPKPF